MTIHWKAQSGGALSDGTISFSIQPFSGDKSIFRIFLKKPQSIPKELN
jgi:hypothetical protein